MYNNRTHVAANPVVTPSNKNSTPKGNGTPEKDDGGTSPKKGEVRR